MTSVTDSAGFSTVIADVDLEALFTSISNHVALAGNNVSVEMLQLAAEVYGPDVESHFDLAFSHDPLPFELQPGQQGRNTGATVAVAPQTRGWDAVTASELGMAAEDQSSPLKYSFVGGQYQGLDTNLAEANALVLTGLVHDPVSGTDKRTLALVIRGTDQAADALFDYHNFGTHYAKFAPLVAALQNYLAANADGIQQVLISGHSLGSGVVPYFLQAFPDTASYTVRAYVDGPTGSEVDLVDSRIVNFVHAGMMFPAAGDHEGDNVPMLGEVSHGDYSNIGNTNVPNGQTGKQWIDGIIKGFPLLPSGILRKTRDGSDILIDSDVPQPVPTSFAGLVGPQHNPNLYAADLAKLVRFANDDSSPFAGTDAALALKSGTVYQGPSVAIAVGQPDTAELGALTSTTTNFVDPSVYVGKPYASDINVYWRDDYVLGEANGTIHWDQPWTSSSPGSFNPAEHVHVVDGGSTTAPSTVVLQGSSTAYRFTTISTALGPESDVNWVDSASVEHLIGHLYRTDKVMFLPTTTSSAAEPQFMLHLDGSAVTVQTALAGQTALTVDPSFDYTDAGDENHTITGSGLGDIIALGSGNNTVIETTGSNIIFVKDAATAGSNTIHGGDGYDTIVGGQGNDTIVGGSGITTVYYSGARSEYQITRLDNGALQIADPGIGTPEGTDTLSGVEFFRFADKTYSFTAPLIATTDVAAVYGQTFAASDLFAAVDSDDPILSYQLLDNTPDPTSGKWLLGGAVQTASQIIDVSAAQLAQTEFQSGFGTDSLSVRAFDGIDWSEWTPLTVASPTSLLIGVNLAGAEFAPPYDTNTGQRTSSPDPGVFGTNYTYPTHVEIDYYAAKGMSVLRLPFLWERIQPTQLGSLDAAELGRIDDVVNYATGKGLKIEIEPHNYGFGFGSLIDSAQTPNSSFADLWGKLAVHYKSNPGVIFGLMNEPHEQTATVWLGSANAAIAAIRSAGAMQEILVPGTYWDGAWHWTTTDNYTVIGTGVQDPLQNFAFEVHQYLDQDGSGTSGGVYNNDPNLGVERLTAITQWAVEHKQRLFLGEVGVDQQPISLEALGKMLSYIKQHTDVWSGVTYWAGGPWWVTPPYMFSIEPQNVNDPSNYGDKPQMGILMALGADTAAASILENTTAVTTGMATDPDTGQTLSYSINGGADAGKFTIGSTTGALSFVTAPNFELPTDLGGNNVYDVTVQVSDGHGGIDTQAIAVAVTNVNETPAFSAFNEIIRASTDANGHEGNNTSVVPSLSADGRYLAFSSYASDLVTGDTNGVQDVFVRDLQTGAFARVSTNANGDQGNNSSDTPRLSADGRYVAFNSAASNLVSGDVNGTYDVFVRDLQTGATSRVSTDVNGVEGNNNSYVGSISADGRYAAFYSWASNLVPGDVNGNFDIFVRDLQTGAIICASTDANGSQGNDHSYSPSMSADGRYVAFASGASNLVPGDTNGTYDIFVRDLQTGATSRVSTDVNGVEGNNNSYGASLSADGRYVAFASSASNLVPGDTNGTYDIFVRGLQTGAISRVSTDADGVQGNNDSYEVTLSANGRYVAFDSSASNLVPYDTNGHRDIFVRDLQTGATSRVSTDVNGVEGNRDSIVWDISTDGRYVAFWSDASNLVPDDTNGTHDVFVASTNFAAEVSIAENTTAVTIVTATDPDAGQTLTYSITGGADAGKFRIGSSTGALSFVTAPNFELPTDVGGNNVYDVTVQVSDGNGGIDTQAIAVSVQNVVGVTINGTAGNDVIDMTHTVAGQPFPTNEEDILNGGAGSDTLAGGPGADKFVFDLTALTPAQPGSAIVDHILDYNLAEGDTFDFSALLSAGSGQPVGDLVRVLDTPNGTAAILQIDQDGAANGAHWTTIAQLDGVHAGDSVKIIMNGGATANITATLVDPTAFAQPSFELAAFTPGTGGWISDDLYKRELADVNGDGRADIAGFASSGVYVSLATGNGHFAAPTFELAAFTPGTGGWISDDLYKRELADVNGDGRADIVGFASSGVYVSLASGNGHFAAPTFELGAFTPGSSWISDDLYKRELADVNGDGRADIVGFASSGVYVSLASGNGHFAAPTFELAAFTPGTGGWISDDLYKRELADVNGDGRADIVGFASSGVYVSMASGTGHFAAPTFELGAFTPGSSWISDDLYKRELADVNGDGRADIVGFASSGVYVSLATGNGHFATPTFELAAFAPGAGGWISDNLYKRELADVNGDGSADIVGFANSGVYVSQAHDFLLI